MKVGVSGNSGLLAIHAARELSVWIARKKIESKDQTRANILPDETLLSPSADLCFIAVLAFVQGLVTDVQLRILRDGKADETCDTRNEAVLDAGRI